MFPCHRLTRNYFQSRMHYPSMRVSEMRATAPLQAAPLSIVKLDAPAETLMLVMDLSRVGVNRLLPSTLSQSPMNDRYAGKTFEVDPPHMQIIS